MERAGDTASMDLPSPRCGRTLPTTRSRPVLRTSLIGLRSGCCLRRTDRRSSSSRAACRSCTSARLHSRRWRLSFVAVLFRLAHLSFLSCCTCRRMSLEIVKPQVPVLLRSEEHTSELQSRENLVCRLLLEKKKNI